MAPRMHLVTYSSGGLEWGMAARRLVSQARASGAFASAEVFTPNRLAKMSSEAAPHLPLLTMGARGGGFWLWKPLLIKVALDRVARGEVVLYLDAGCELNLRPSIARQRLEAYRDQAHDEGWLLFGTPHPMVEWTKRDLLDLAGIDRTRAAAENQVEAGVGFYAAADASLNLVNEWVGISVRERYKYLDDTPSIQTEYPEFIEHRHDQAVLSVLLDCLGYQAPPREHWFHPHWRIEGRQSPIWACRNSGPYSVTWPLGDFYARVNWKVRSMRRGN